MYPWFPDRSVEEKKIIEAKRSYFETFNSSTPYTFDAIDTYFKDFRTFGEFLTYAHIPDSGHIKFFHPNLTKHGYPLGIHDTSKDKPYKKVLKSKMGFRRYGGSNGQK